MQAMTPRVLFELGPVAFTDTLITSLALSLLLALAGILAMRLRSAHEVLEVLYEQVEELLQDMVSVDVSELIPLVLTQWIFIVAANLAGLLPGVSSPTRDLSLTAALAVISFGAGHVYGFRAQGLSYLRHYIEPNPILLPFNLVGELSRTLALALRLFGNMLSGQIIGAILVSLAGLLLPVPLMLLSVLTSVVQAYIFGVLTLVFTASAMQVAGRRLDTPGPAQEASQ